MKNTKQLFLFFLLLTSFGSIAQTYEVRRIDNERKGLNYGNTPSYGETIRYIGGIQSQMQARYDYNHQKISDKLDDIGSIVRKLTRNGFKVTDSKKIFLDEYSENLEKIDRINFSDNVAVTKVMSYLRYVEEELQTW